MGNVGASTVLSQPTVSAPLRFDALPDVVIQLTCHGLQRAEIFSLARCSKRVMHACDAPLAWAHTPPLWVTTYRLRLIEVQGQSACLASRLPLSIVWLDEIASTAALSRDFLSLPFIRSGGLPRIRSLDLSSLKSNIVSTEQWMPLVADPAFCGLHELRLYSLERRGQLFTFALEALCALRCLHSLAVFPHSTSADHVDWTVLRGCPALTSLEMCDARGFTVPSQLPMIAQCGNLRKLRLTGFTHTISELFESLALLPLLSVLCINDRFCADDTKGNLREQLRSALGPMGSLTELQLTQWETIALIAPALSSARSLRLLVAKGLGLDSLSLLIDSGVIASGLAGLPQCIFETREANEDDL